MADVNTPALEARFLEPPAFVWGTFPTARGALRWGRLPGAGPTCVVVGGFIEFIEKYFETIRDLSQRGFDVWCLDWLAQGGSPRPAADPTRPMARDYDADAEDLVRFAESMTPKNRLLVAHSMGGAIGTLALARHPDTFDAAVLSAPMFGIMFGPLPKWLVSAIVAGAMAVGAGSHFVPGAGAWAPTPGLNAATSHVCSDAQRCLVLEAWFTARPGLRVDGATYSWVDAALHFMHRLMRPECLARVTTPVLIGSALRETFVDPRVHRRAAKLLPDCRLIEFPDSKHEIFMEVDAIRKPWFAAIDDFIAARFPRHATPRNVNSAAQ